MLRQAFLAVLCMAFVGCTSQKVVEVDPKTGRFPTTATATVTLNKPYELDAHRALVIVPNSEFVKGEVVNMHFFTQVMTVEELERAVVQKGLNDKVPTLTDQIGLNNAAKYYAPFLWLHFKHRGTGSDQYSQLILTDAATLDDLWIAETHLDYLWAGVNDQHNWYPMFNALIDYLQANSSSYRR